MNSGRSDEVETFFKPQTIGKNTLNRIVRDVCRSLGIRGEGANKYVTTHVLRATMLSLLITCGHSDAAVVLRSGHRNNNSLQSYQNLMGRNGEAQLAAVFGGAHEVSKQNPAEISAHNMKRAIAANLEPTEKMDVMHGDTQTETPQKKACAGS